MSLKKIIIADEATGEVLDIMYTDEEVKDVHNALEGYSKYGVSLFDTKEDWEEANFDEDPVK